MDTGSNQNHRPMEVLPGRMRSWGGRVGGGVRRGRRGLVLSEGVEVTRGWRWPWLEGSGGVRGGVRCFKRPPKDGVSLLQLHQQIALSHRLSGLAVDALHLRGGGGGAKMTKGFRRRRSKMTRDDQRVGPDEDMDTTHRTVSSFCAGPGSRDITNISLLFDIVSGVAHLSSLGRRHAVLHLHGLDHADLLALGHLQTHNTRSYTDA